MSNLFQDYEEKEKNEVYYAKISRETKLSVPHY